MANGRSKGPQSLAKLLRTVVTPRWKAAVMRKIETNRVAGSPPVTASELARMVGAHKTGLLKMLTTDQPTYRYAPRICEVLVVPTAVVDNPELPEVSQRDIDDMEAAFAKIRAQPEARRRHAMAVLKTFIDPVDEE